MDDFRNFDAIVNTVMDIVSKIPENRIRPNKYATSTFVRQALTAKKNLIDVLSKHPLWDADNYRIHFKADFTRLVNQSEAETALYEMAVEVYKGCKNKREEMMRDGVWDENSDEAIKLNALSCFAKVLTDSYELRITLSGRDEVLATTEDIIGLVEYYRQAYFGFHLDPETGERVEVISDLKMHVGRKITRETLNLFRLLGFDNLPKEYHDRAVKAYGIYCDHLNPIKVTRHTVLSVNPADFLLMSNGNSWHSCYVTAYFKGRIAGSSGCYSVGTAEYACDGQTMLLYTVGAEVDNTDVTYATKYTRECFFWNGNTLVGSRIYPANDDIKSNIYKEHREVVEGVIADCLNLPNLWRRVSWDYIYHGMGYFDPAHRDGEQFHAFELTYMPEEVRRSEYRYVIEAGCDDVTCPSCGETLDVSEQAICSDCSGTRFDRYCDECGAGIDTDVDDYYYICDTGEVICENCYENGYYGRCDCCDDFYTNDSLTLVHDGGCEHYYCTSCLEHALSWGNISYCERCGEYYSSDDMIYVEDWGEYYCEECAEWKDVWKDELTDKYYSPDTECITVDVNHYDLTTGKRRMSLEMLACPESVEKYLAPDVRDEGKYVFKDDLEVLMSLVNEEEVA